MTDMCRSCGESQGDDRHPLLGRVADLAKEIRLALGHPDVMSALEKHGALEVTAALAAKAQVWQSGKPIPNFIDGKLDASDRQLRNAAGMFCPDGPTIHVRFPTHEVKTWTGTWYVDPERSIQSAESFYKDVLLHEYGHALDPFRDTDIAGEDRANCLGKVLGKKLGWL